MNQSLLPFDEQVKMLLVEISRSLKGIDDSLDLLERNIYMIRSNLSGLSKFDKLPCKDSIRINSEKNNSGF